MRSRMIGLVASIAALVTGSAASATVVVETYTGTTYSGTDYVGLFGPAGSSLKDLPVTATFTFDTSQAFLNLGDASFDSYEGGTFFGGVPFGTGVFHIKGFDYTILGHDAGFLAGGFNSGGPWPEQMGEVDLDGDTCTPDCGNTYLFADVYDPTNTHSGLAQRLTHSFTYTVRAGDSSAGGFVVETAADAVTLGSPEAAANFHIDTITVRVLSGVPEPTTWAFMLLGFGGLGALLRRRATAIL